MPISTSTLGGAGALRVRSRSMWIDPVGCIASDWAWVCENTDSEGLIVAKGEGPV